MKKETGIAIILGITLGSIIAIGLIFGTRNNDITNKKVINTKETPTIVKLTNSAQQFEITAPNNNSTTTGDTIKISGNAPKNSLIVIQSSTSEKAFKTTEPSFATTFNVANGENVISITAYEGNSVNDKALTIYRVSE